MDIINSTENEVNIKFNTSKNVDIPRIIINSTESNTSF
jgi:hypothetical protein